MQCLQGTIILKFNDIVNKLGEPIRYSKGEIIHKWIFTFKDKEGINQQAELYDWKPTTTTCSEYDYYRWHISAADFEAVSYLLNLFKEEIDRYIEDNAKSFEDEE